MKRVMLLLCLIGLLNQGFAGGIIKVKSRPYEPKKVIVVTNNPVRPNYVWVPGHWVYNPLLNAKIWVAPHWKKI